MHAITWTRIDMGFQKADRGELYGWAGQVCLAAEECGHLNFDSRTDMWWNGDAFHCGSGPRGIVHFHDIIFKVHSQPFLVRMFGVCFLV